MFSLICAWINGWVNNRQAGDLKRYHAHYDAIVMKESFKNSGFVDKCPKMKTALLAVAKQICKLRLFHILYAIMFKEHSTFPTIFNVGLIG